MKIGAIVQARMSSTRLPGKILKDLPFGSGITVLEQVMRRLKKAKGLDCLAVATTQDSLDDKTVLVARKEKVGYFRGSVSDVLSRYYHCAKKFGFNVIARITSDCPCIDPETIDLIIKEHLERKADYTSNTLKRTYPHGLDVEVFNFNALALAHKKARLDHDREHVTPFITKNPGLFRIEQVLCPSKPFASDIRVTLDTEQDYVLLCAVFDQLYFKKRYFNSRDIIRLFKERPWLKLINRSVVQKRQFDSLKDELNAAARILELQELKHAAGIIKKLI